MKVVAQQRWFRASVLALACAAAPVVAQPPPENAEISEEALAEQPADSTAEPASPLAALDEAQIIEMFAMLSESEAMQDEIAPVMAELFEPGAPLPDWRTRGVDLIAELGARDGGLAGNLLRDDDTEVLSVMDLSGKAAPDLTGFSRLRLRAAPEGTAEITYASFSPGVWLAVESRRTLRGTAHCYDSANGITVYSTTPPNSWDIYTTFSLIGIVALFEAMGDREFCSIHEREGDAFRVRMVLPDGRSLPNLDAQATLVRIMPASELSAVLRQAVPVPAAE